MWHFRLDLRLSAIHMGILTLCGGRRGPYAPYRTSIDIRLRRVFGEGTTEMKAVFSIEMRGMISTNS